MKVLDKLVYIDVSTFIQLDLLDRGCPVQRQVGSRFCNRHGDEAEDVGDCFSLRWFYFRVSSLKINNITPEKARLHPKSTDIFLISARKHMLWVLIRCAEATTYVFVQK